MDYSYAELIRVRCIECLSEYSGEQWLIVDVLARPDLYARVLEGTLHDFRCPHCLIACVKAEVPFLLFRADAQLKLIFCAPLEMASEEIQVQSDTRLSALKQRMGDAWDDNWPEDSMASALAPSLERTLDDDWSDLPRYGKNDPVLSRMFEFLNARDLTEKRRVLFACPDLLGHTALKFLRQFIDTSQEQGATARAEDLSAQKRLLERCTEVGVEDAFAEAARQEEASALLAGLDPQARALLAEAFTTPASPAAVVRQIEVCTELLARLDPQRNFQLWVEVQVRLGIRYTENPEGDRRENLERAVELIERARAALSPEMATDQWVSATVDLSHAYQERLEGNRADNFEKAIALCEESLRYISEEENPALFCSVAGALAAAYLDRIKGDRIDNIERSIAWHDKALSLSDNPADRAIALHNLARAYSLRVRGTADENAELAIVAYETALSMLSPTDNSVLWALGTDNLATCVLNRKRGDRSDNVERAIELYRQALEVRTRRSMPYEWARTTMNLGTAYAQRVAGDRAEHLSLAVNCFEQSMEVLDREHFPLLWADLQTNAAQALSFGAGDLALRDNARAVAAFKAALEVFRPQTYPFQCRQTAYRLGQLYFSAGDWQEAFRHFATGLDAAEALYRAAYVPLNQRIEMQINADLYDRMVATCARAGGDAEMRRAGLVYAEAGRDRRFIDQMGAANFPPPAGVNQELLRREAELLFSLKELERALSSADLTVEIERKLSEEKQEINRKLGLIWREIEEIAPAYISLRRGETPSWQNLESLSAELGSEAALVSFYTLEDEIICFVLRAGWEAPVVKRCPVSRSKLVNRYLSPYRREVLDHVELARSGQRATNAWMQLGEPLLGPLMDEIKDASLVYFIPHGDLHTLPLHALIVNGVPFIEHHATAYAPSAGVLLRTLEAKKAEAGELKALVLGYTPSADEHERALFLGEAQSVAERFGTAAIIDGQATCAALREHAPTAALVHLSCHGLFDAHDPLNSGLLLADGKFTAREWMELSLQADLITLSACESGFTKTGRGDEIAGLSRALLYAGASTALLTLWQVDAATTLAWVLDFYNELRSPAGHKIESEAAAFRHATLSLRARHPDPVHWAPFILVGDWR
jgi:CHAT domain-containing protein